MPETSNFKNQAVRIGKGVPMGTVNFDAVGGMGNPVMAIPAKDKFLLLFILSGRRLIHCHRLFALFLLLA